MPTNDDTLTPIIERAAPKAIAAFAIARADALDAEPRNPRNDGSSDRLIIRADELRDFAADIRSGAHRGGVKCIRCGDAGRVEFGSTGGLVDCPVCAADIRANAHRKGEG